MKNFVHSILNSNELYTASKRINEIATQNLGDDSYVVKVCAKLDEDNSDMAKALGKALNSVFTPQLIEKDDKRDMAFIGLRDYISAYCHSNSPAKVSAALALSAIIGDIGNSIYNLGYAAETAKLNELFTRLSTPDAVQAIDLIGAGDWLGQLKLSQDEFENVYKTKIDVESGIDYPLVKDAKKRIITHLDALLSYIDCSTGLDPVKFAPVQAQIEEVITDTVAIARSRKTRKDNNANTAKEQSGK